MALFNDSFVYNYSLKPVVSIRTLNSPQNRHERQRICKSICTNGVSLVGEVVAVVRKVYTEKKCAWYKLTPIILSTILQRFCHTIVEKKIDSLLTNDIKAYYFFLWKDPM